MDNATEYRCDLWSPKKAIHEIILNHSYLSWSWNHRVFNFRICLSIYFQLIQAVSKLVSTKLDISAAHYYILKIRYGDKL